MILLCLHKIILNKHNFITVLLNYLFSTNTINSTVYNELHFQTDETVIEIFLFTFHFFI